MTRRVAEPGEQWVVPGYRDGDPLPPLRPGFDPRRYRGRHRRNARLLLAVATITPGFDGDFVDLAALMGWTHGERWRLNPAIWVARAWWDARATCASSATGGRPSPRR